MSIINITSVCVSHFNIAVCHNIYLSDYSRLPYKMFTSIDEDCLHETNENALTHEK